MPHPLAAHREQIDAALDAGASKAATARALGVSKGVLVYYLDHRDLVRKDDSDIQAALARLAADAQG